MVLVLVLLDEEVVEEVVVDAALEFNVRVLSTAIVNGLLIKSTLVPVIANT